MTWESFYCAPVVFATMVPFWALMSLGYSWMYGVPARYAVPLAIVWGLFSAVLVWFLLFFLPGYLFGVYEWGPG